MHESRKNKLTFPQFTRSTHGTPLVSKADADRELVESFRAKQQRMLRSPSGAILPAKASTLPPSQPAKPDLIPPSQQPRMTSNGLPIYNYPPGKKHLSARDIENMRLNRYSPPVQESEELRQSPQSFSHPQKLPYSPTQEAFRFRQAMTKKRNYISARDRENMPSSSPFPSQSIRKNGQLVPHPNAPAQYHDSFQKLQTEHFDPLKSIEEQLQQLEENWYRSTNPVEKTFLEGQILGLQQQQQKLKYHWLANDTVTNDKQPDIFMPFTQMYDPDNPMHNLTTNPSNYFNCVYITLVGFPVIDTEETIIKTDGNEEGYERKTYRFFASIENFNNSLMNIDYTFITEQRPSSSATSGTLFDRKKKTQFYAEHGTPGFQPQDINTIKNVKKEEKSIESTYSEKIMDLAKTNKIPGLKYPLIEVVFYSCDTPPDPDNPHLGATYKIVSIKKIYMTSEQIINLK